MCLLSCEELHGDLVQGIIGSTMDLDASLHGFYSVNKVGVLSRVSSAYSVLHGVVQ